MAKSKSQDRITVSFYEEIKMDMVVLQALNQSCPPRMRSNKIKEWAYEYVKMNPDLYDTTIIPTNNTKTEDIEENNKPQHKKNSKSKLKSKLNIITK